MQFIEANGAGVRVVELLLWRPGSPMRFVLYPMIHIGRRDFYQEVSRRLRAADLIIAEGVEGESKAGDGLTAGYRLMARAPGLNLTVQSIDFDALGVPVLWPDITGPEFEERWRTIPLRQRGLMWAGVTSVMAAQRLLGSAWVRFLLERSSLDDLPDDWEDDSFRDVDRVIVNERDALLLAALSDVHDRRSHEPITVAVVYGAEHMKAVVRELNSRHGYRVRSGDWLTVMVFE